MIHSPPPPFTSSRPLAIWWPHEFHLLCTVHFHPTFIIFWYSSGDTPGGIPIPPIPPMPPKPDMAPNPKGSPPPPGPATVLSPAPSRSRSASSPSPPALTAKAFSACIKTRKKIIMLWWLLAVATYSMGYTQGRGGGGCTSVRGSCFTALPFEVPACPHTKVQS